MKRHQIIILLTLAAAAACNKNATPEPEPTPEPTIYGSITDSTAIARYWKERYGDGAMVSSSDVVSMNSFVDGSYVDGYVAPTNTSDNRYEFYGDSTMRFVSRPDGYAISVPVSRHPKVDYTLAKYGLKINMDDARLRITFETVDGYSHDANGYELYTTHWLNRYFASSKFLKQNDLAFYQNSTKKSTEVLEGYEVSIYSIRIDKADNFELPFYKIAIIRKANQYINFGFLLLKSKEDMSDEFLAMVKSWKTFGTGGTCRNYMPQQVPTPNPKWDAATAAYYQQLLDQQSTGWGAFSASMVIESDAEWTGNYKTISSEKARLEGEEGWNHKFDIMPTYAALSWYGTIYNFPVTMANEFAGGDGTNGKPVLQYTFGFTTTNNNVSTSNTTNNPAPIFDVIRGDYDDYFRKLARDINTYGKPMLFRLNNEMNSDWTSYCGMMTLADPEIFQEGWKHLYNIFEEEGVDNCIWIFNPNGVTAPYCRWGEDICFYPGQDYVQILGLTWYQSNNDGDPESFKSSYTKLWNRNKQVFEAMPEVISEFGCGSGGNSSGVLMRNEDSQAQWVTDMFNEFKERPEYVQNIKGAIWFSVNDGEDNSIYNYYYLDPRLTKTLAAFRAGFAD